MSPTAVLLHNLCHCLPNIFQLPAPYQCKELIEETSHRQYQCWPSSMLHSMTMSYRPVFSGYGWFHYRLLLVCGWALSSDAIEVLSISFVLPPATCDLQLTSADKGWLTAIIFVGKTIITSWFGNNCRNAGPLWREVTSQQRVLLSKSQWGEFFIVSLNTLLNKQSSCRLFEMSLHSFGVTIYLPLSTCEINLQNFDNF